MTLGWFAKLPIHNAFAGFVAAGLAAFAILLGGRAAVAQTFQFSQVGAAHGLANVSITAFAQDHEGLMWMATQNGLVRYDGYRSTIYRRNRANPHSLPHGDITALFVGRDGTLWIGTRNGLSRYDRDLDHFENYLDEGETPGSPGHQIGSLLEDSHGNFWIGTGGLLRFDRTTGTTSFYDVGGEDALGGAWITVLFEDRHGFVWIGTEGRGLHRLDPRTGDVVSFVHDDADPTSLPADNVQGAAEDGTGELWVGTYGGGIAHFNRQTNRFRRFRHEPGNSNSLASDQVMRLAAARDGGLWIATETGGLDHYQPLTGAFSHNQSDGSDPTKLANNSIWSVFQDPSGVLWVGAYAGGVRIAKPNSRAIRHFAPRPESYNALNNGRVFDFDEDRDGNIWIATDGGGLNRYNPHNAFIDYFVMWNSALPIDGILSVAADPDGSVWAGSWGGGLTRFDPKTDSAETFTKSNSNLLDDNIFSVHVDRAGRLWVGTFQHGLLLFDRQRRSFSRRVLDPELHPQAQIWVLTELRDGRLLVGTSYRGFGVLDVETGRMDRYLSDASDENSLSSNEIRAFLEAEPGILWVGTAGGLDRLNLATGEIVRYTEEEGLPSNSIAGLAQDDEGNLWISTDRGITRFNPSANRFRQYTIVDGLQSNEFNPRSYFVASDGTLYFGGNNGFNVIDPRRIVRNERKPPVLITGFQLFNKPVAIGEAGSPLARHISVTEHLVLRHDHSVFTLEYVALDYTAPEQNEYAYRLEGFDREWVYVGKQRSATYTNLPPGEYVFRVKAANNDGVWNEAGASLRITITPPWWQTWWFRTGVVLLVVGVAAGMGLSVRRRRRRLEEMNARLAEAAERDRRSQRYLAGNVREMLAAMQRFSEGDHEVTLAVESEDEIGKLRQGFNAVVADRKRAEEELRQSQKMEAVGRLAGGVAHDFNNLLTVIKGNTELALDLAREAAQREELEEIQRAAERASALTRQLLAFSRKQILQPRLLSLNEVVVELGRLLRRTVGEDIELRIDLEPALGQVRADRGQVEQVVLNLVVNARDAMPQGGELRIATRNVGVEEVWRHAEAERIPYVMLEVRDTGMGMEAEVLERIFEPFFTTKEQGKGTGLGLSTVYGIVSQSGGYVRVESEVGVGSRFAVYLPRVEEAAEVREAEAAGGGEGGSETVLLTEDEDAVRLLAKRVLARQGYRVLAARSGAEALELAAQHEGEIHLLLTDVVMPGMSGRELAQQLLPQRPRMRLLYTSGYTEDAIVRHGVSGQETAFLQKPFAPDALARKVREVLDAPRLAPRMSRNRMPGGRGGGGGIGGHRRPADSFVKQHPEET